MEIAEKAQRMLEKYPLCNHCLGRQFAFLGHGVENRERGETLKALLTMTGHRLVLSKDKRGVPLLKVLSENGSFPMATEILRKLRRRTKQGKRCFLCDGCFELLASLIERVVERLKGCEYETFLVGVKLPIEVEEREDEFKAEFEVQHGENMRNEFSRVVGKMLSEITDKPVDFAKPEMTVLLNPFTDKVDLQASPLFIRGRYRKLVRGIPQSVWFCVECRGKGCPTCSWKGRMYPESVEELITGPALEVTGGEEASFHGAGREDIDARMLGRGRPFVIQIKRPRKRRIDLSVLEGATNKRAEGKVEVRELRFVGREAVRRLKHMESAQKMYRVVARFDREISDAEIEELKSSFTGVTVLQQTPKRVSHRRVDRTREKHIYETKVKRLSPNSVEMRVRCQGGLYVKELVTGDGGRTEPNVSATVNAKAEPLELDVLNIFTKGGRS